jgi:hypothetical protein
MPIHAAVALALNLALSSKPSPRSSYGGAPVPAWVAGMSVGLLAIVFLEVGLGYNKRYWLHVPIGVGIFGGLIRQTDRLDTLPLAVGERQ